MPKTARMPRSHYVLIALLTLFAFFWGVYGLNNDTLYFDGELISLGHIGVLPGQGDYSPVDTLQSVANWSPQHSPGFFFILNLYYHVLGISNPAILRTLALFLGVLFVPMMYRLGTQAISRRVGLIAAVIAASSFPFLDMLHAVRMYAPLAMMLAFMLSQYLYIVNPKHKPRFGAYLVLLLSSSAALYLSYLAIMAMVGMGVYHLLCVRKDRRWWVVVGVMLLVGVSFLPWLNVMIRGQTIRNELDSPYNLRGASLGYVTMISNGGLFLLGITTLSTIAATFKSIRVRQLVAIWAGAALALFAFHAIDPLLSVNRARYFVVLFPATFLMIAIGINALDQWRVSRVVFERVRWRSINATIVMLALWVGMALYAHDKNFLNVFYTTGNKQQDLHTPYHVYLTVLPRYIPAGETVVTFTRRASAAEPMKMGISSADYYFGELGLRYISFIDEYEPADSDILRQQINSVMNDEITFWLVVPHIRGDIHFGEYAAIIASQFTPCAEPIVDSELTITRYATDQATCDDPSAVRLPVPLLPPLGEVANLTNLP